MVSYGQVSKHSLDMTGVCRSASSTHSINAHQHSQHQWPCTPQDPAFTWAVPPRTSSACHLLSRVQHRQPCHSVQQRQDSHPAGFPSPLLPEKLQAPRGTLSTQSSLGPIVSIFLTWHWAACIFQDQTPWFSVGWQSRRCF